MFDYSFPAAPIPHAVGKPPICPNLAPDPELRFALTMPERNAAAAMAGEARPRVLGRFALLAEAMLGAIAHAERLGAGAAPQMLAILDREDRLVLAGAASAGAVAWCSPVASAAEARAVVSEASQLRAQARRATGWQEAELAARLRQRAELLEACLVDPLWRAFAARALQMAA
ncbi:DNA repair protein RadC [Tabrizicola oligotrophica]|uniref:DNA repair protein RadC n=1 Tax=Tabrizicola oligotrophica TaxID=2710650 RepID=A0A6M0QYR5_9RHOB|nr:DNA repair protein RadC [Tabrizicola oligotrophica]NEY92161.1 DNA repair protein RadC [Tabrizicola oligotrophica]